VEFRDRGDHHGGRTAGVHSAAKALAFAGRCCMLVQLREPRPLWALGVGFRDVPWLTQSLHRFPPPPLAILISLQHLSPAFPPPPPSPRCTVSPGKARGRHRRVPLEQRKRALCRRRRNRGRASEICAVDQLKSSCASVLLPSGPATSAADLRPVQRGGTGAPDGPNPASGAQPQTKSPRTSKGPQAGVARCRGTAKARQRSHDPGSTNRAKHPP